jgi:hypothetical protein
LNKLLQELKSKGLVLELVGDELILKGERVDTSTLEEIRKNKEQIRAYLKGNDRNNKPYINQYGDLIIPFGSGPIYHYWAAGQSLVQTLKELGAAEGITNQYDN